MFIPAREAAAFFCAPGSEESPIRSERRLSRSRAKTATTQAIAAYLMAVIIVHPGRRRVYCASATIDAMNRREFLLATGAAAPATASLDPAGGGESSAIDFRYAPLRGQTAYCFPDDHAKSLIGEGGDLRYGHPGQGKGIDYFPVIVEFLLTGMEAGTVARQELESPGVPIVHTRIDRPEAYLELTTFATNQPGEGRVDNVIVDVRPRREGTLHAAPQLLVRTRREVTVERAGSAWAARLDNASGPVLLASAVELRRADRGSDVLLSAPAGEASPGSPLRYFFRFPQEGQTLERVAAGLANPAALLDAARRWWLGWRPFGGEVGWQLASRHGEFLLACARNILQAREVRDGKLTFQVGPTVYRGLWVVDGHFILEAARYLGHDAEAQQGLETTWARQNAEGGIFAGAGNAHWKDTGIAMFTLVRQAELAQDWSYFRKMTPAVLRGVKYIESLREKARAEGSVCGRYGLLARGMGDGGLGGIRDEFTNTLWSLAGLKAVADTGTRLGIPEYTGVRKVYRDLRAACDRAMREEMRRHAAGFDYLPMLMKEDAQWNAPREWDRARPQSGQWALSQAIYPGLLFEPNDPVVKGHVELMKACTQEDVPAETGWLPHEGLWNYGAAFAAHAYLWAGEAQWARSTFTGFLNHATPLYCWREEQPIRGSVYSGYVGDMPHNWASAECVLFLRHMLALEDGTALRLLAGIGDFELAAGEPYRIAASPTRFGRVSLKLEPAGGGAWRAEFRRGAGPAPARVELPAALGRLEFAEVRGAATRTEGGAVLVAPDASGWNAIYRQIA